MRGKLSRLSGYTLLIGAILGIALSLFGTWAVWRSVPLLEARIDSILDLFDDTLETSAQGLAIVSDSLAQTVETVVYVQEASVDLVDSLEDTIPFIDNVGTLVGEDMNDIIRNTQTSLDSAQTSARIVDDTLRIITSIPLIGNFIGDRYAPPVPLSESIGSVSDSLDAMPESLTEIETGLKLTAENMRGIQGEVTVLREKVNAAEAQLAEAQTVVVDYQTQVGALQERMFSLRVNVPKWLNWYKWGLTVFFVWLGIAQLGLLFQGLNLLDNRDWVQAAVPADHIHVDEVGQPEA